MSNPIVQSRFLPYQADYALLSKWRRVESILLVSVGSLSIAAPLVSTNLQNKTVLNHIVEYASYIAIVSYYVVHIVTEVFLYPRTARLRRISFIDNSLGAKFLVKESKNYFSNDTLEPGMYKMSVNCFENCFFTYNIAKEMTSSVVAKNAIFSAVFLTIAYIGLRGNVVALPILQVLLSTLFITELVHHLAFVSRLRVLLDKFEMHFLDTLDSKSRRNDGQRPILMLLEYETILAFNKAPLSDRAYKKLNVKLTTEWEGVKRHYEIS